MFGGMLPILKRTPFHQDLFVDGDCYYEFNNAKPSLQFTPDEITKGRKLLKQMNVDFDNDEYICIFARDSAYLKKVIPENNWSGFNTRDSEIDSLIETAKYLIEKGFVVIRIGSVAKKPINFSHKKMIDYPFSGYRSDFLDIFINAQCKFFISTGRSGIDSVAQVFDRPLLLTNVQEFGNLKYSGKNCLYTSKKYKYSNN